MALSETKVSKIKVDVEAGLLTKSKIANKHKINRLTLYNLIEKHNWDYGKNKQEINKITELKTLEKVISQQVDNATEITNVFLNDLKDHRKSILTVSSAYMKLVDSTENNVSKDDADRLFTAGKLNKILAEALNTCYTGARKALGMDRDEEVRKAKLLKETENTPVTDPLEGKTLDQAKEELERLRNR